MVHCAEPGARLPVGWCRDGGTARFMAVVSLRGISDSLGFTSASPPAYGIVSGVWQ